MMEELLKKQVIELHNNARDKGFRKSPFVSEVWGGMGYVYSVDERNIGYVLWDIQKWLREKHKLVVYVEVIGLNLYYRPVINIENGNGHKTIWTNLNDDTSQNWEEALSSGLEKALEDI